MSLYHGKTNPCMCARCYEARFEPDRSGALALGAIVEIGAEYRMAESPPYSDRGYYVPSGREGVYTIVELGRDDYGLARGVYADIAGIDAELYCHRRRGMIRAVKDAP